MATQDFPLGGFTAIEAAGFDLEIVQSETFSVVVSADSNVMNAVRVRTFGEALILQLRHTPWFFRRRTPEARIMMPSLTEIVLSGASSAHIGGFEGIDQLVLNLSGASDLRGKLEARAIDLVASGASRAVLTGSASRVIIEASGASRLDLDRMVVGSADIELSGASRASVNVTSAIESIVASGASSLRYLGDPSVGRMDTSGASSVNRARSA